MGGLRGGSGGILVSWELVERAPENTAVPGGADCGTSCDPRRFKKGFVGFGGKEGGGGFAGAEVIVATPDVGCVPEPPFIENGLLTGEGTRERFPRGEGERDASSSGRAIQWQ